LFGLFVFGVLAKLLLLLRGFVVVVFVDCAVVVDDELGN